VCPPLFSAVLPSQQRRGDHPQRADGLCKSISTAASMTSSMCAQDGRSLPSEMIRAVAVIRRVPISRGDHLAVAPWSVRSGSPTFDRRLGSVSHCVGLPDRRLRYRRRVVSSRLGCAWPCVSIANGSILFAVSGLLRRGGDCQGT
jgi:hypothetical protein